MTTEDVQIKSLEEAVVNLDEALHEVEEHVKALTVLYEDLKRQVSILNHDLAYRQLPGKILGIHINE